MELELTIAYVQPFVKKPTKTFTRPARHTADICILLSLSSVTRVHLFSIFFMCRKD